MLSFGEKLRLLRESKGETQEDIARLLKISRAAVSKYESDQREPDIETIKALARHFNVSVDHIFGLSESNLPECPSDNIIPPEDGNMIEVPDNVTALINHGIPEDVERIIKNQSFIQLALKIKENNLDIELIDNIINNIILLKKKG